MKWLHLHISPFSNLCAYWVRGNHCVLCNKPACRVVWCPKGISNDNRTYVYVACILYNNQTTVKCTLMLIYTSNFYWLYTWGGYKSTQSSSINYQYTMVMSLNMGKACSCLLLFHTSCAGWLGRRSLPQIAGYESYFIDFGLCWHTNFQ